MSDTVIFSVAIGMPGYLPNSLTVHEKYMDAVQELLDWRKELLDDGVHFTNITGSAFNGLYECSDPWLVADIQEIPVSVSDGMYSFDGTSADTLAGLVERLNDRG